MSTIEVTKIETELKPINVEIMSLEQAAEALVIDLKNYDAGYAKAADLLDVVKTKGKALEKLRKFFVDPLNQQVKNINSMFKPQVEYSEKVEALIKDKMATAYDAKESARIKEEKRLEGIRIAADAKRAAEGKEAIAEPIKQVAAPSTFVNTGNSKAQVRKVWTHEILSINALPDDIKKAIFEEAFRKGIITSVVQKFVDAGMRDIAGVRIYEETKIASGNVRRF